MGHNEMAANGQQCLSGLSQETGQAQTANTKSIITGAMAMSLILNTTTAAVAGTPDEAAIKTAVESVATLADSRNFESLEKLYADRVRVDYTSAFGGEVEVKTPQALMTAWAGLLPGFDRTRHAISNVQVKVDGSMAAASAEVTADHWITGRHWQVTGSYDYSFTNTGGEWRITAMTFHLKNECGSRDVLGHAANAANSRPVSYLERQRTQQAVRDFLTSLEEKDMSKLASVWAEDAVQDMPYSPEGFPQTSSGFHPNHLPPSQSRRGALGHPPYIVPYRPKALRSPGLHYAPEGGFAPRNRGMLKVPFNSPARAWLS